MFWPREIRVWRWAPDDVSGAADGQVPDQGQQQVPDAQQAAQQQVDQGQQQVQPDQQQAAQPQSFLDMVRAQAPQLADQYKDPGLLLGHLLSQSQRAVELEEVARRYQALTPLFPQIQEMLKKRKEEEAAAAQKKSWTAPEWDPEWKAWLARDPQTGKVIARPGAPADVVDKYQAFMRHQDSVLERLARDPESVLLPVFEQKIRKIAEEVAQQQAGRVAEQVSAREFIQSNPWLRDQSGRLSEAGQIFLQNLDVLHRQGVTEPGLQQQLALMATRNAFYERALAQNPQQQSQQQKDNFLASAQRQAQPGAVAVNGAVGAPMKVSTNPLENELLAAMVASGYQPGQTLPR